MPACAGRQAHFHYSLNHMKNFISWSIFAHLFIFLTLFSCSRKEAEDKAKKLSSEASFKLLNNDKKGAIADISEAIKLDGKSEYYIKRAEYKMSGNDFDSKGAIEDVSEAIRLDGKPAYYATRAEYKAIANLSQKEVLDDLNKAIALLESGKKDDLTPVALINTWKARANLHAKMSNQAEALKDLTLLIDTYSKVAEDKQQYCIANVIDAYLQRGFIAYSTDKKEALANFVKALEISQGKNVDALYNMGVIKTELADFEGALSCYNQAVNIGEVSGAVYSNRGMVLMELKRLDEACKDWQQARRMGEQMGNQNIRKYCR